MELRDYLRVLRRRKWILLTIVALSVGLAWGQSRLATPMYEARARLFLSQSGITASDIVEGLAGVQLSHQLVRSYSEIATSGPLLERTIDRLDLPVSAAALAGRVDAVPVRDTLLIDLIVTDPSPDRAVDVANTLAGLFVDEVGELQGAGGREPVLEVQVIEPATEPSSPVTPRPKLNIVLGSLAGLVLGLLAAVTRDNLDARLKDPHEAQRMLDLPFLGRMPRVRRGVRLPLDPSSREAEAVRIVRTNVRFAGLPRSAKTILVSSPVVGEGKTTVASSLALALSEAGERVILVDADLRRSSVSRLLDVGGGRGLSDVLLGDVDAASALRAAPGTDLQVLPAGSRPPNPAELLGSPQMRQLLQALRGLADTVVIDSPPLLPVADASILASLTDGVVLVIRHGGTTREEAAMAGEVLADQGRSVLGFVLNRTPARAGSYAFRYRYEPDDRSGPRTSGKGRKGRETRQRAEHEAAEQASMWL